MKTAISLYSYHKLYTTGNFSIFDAVEQTKKYGMDGIELCIFDGYIPEGKTKLQLSLELCEYAMSLGLEVPMFAVGANLYCTDPETETKRLMEHVDIAAECGIPMMRMDVAYSFLGNETSRSPKKVIEFVAPYVRRIAEYGKEKGVKLCSENHGRLIQDSDRIEELLYTVDNDNYGLLCDMGNFGGADEDCAAAVSKLLPHICYVHAKDSFTKSGMLYDPGRGYSRSRGGNWRRATVFGHGDVPTFQILSAIKSSGYDGYVSIEFEGIEDNILALDIGSENLKRMLKDLESAR